MDQIIFNFCAKHNITTLDMRYRDTNLKQFGLNVVPPVITCKLEIDRDALLSIAAFEIEATNIYLQLQEEEKIRKAHPTVASAYNTYKLLLNLTMEHNEPK